MVHTYFIEGETELSLDQLKELGVLYFNLGTENYTETLDAIRSERGYTFTDIVTVAPSHLPNYEEKLKIFFEEHIHADEEIRFFLEGSGYFDVRDRQDRWVRIHAEAGEMIVLPAGIYHRYSNDSNNYAKVMRLFQGDPVWTPLNRATGVEEHPARVAYIAARNSS